MGGRGSLRYFASPLACSSKARITMAKTLIGIQLLNAKSAQFPCEVMNTDGLAILCRRTLIQIATASRPNLGIARPFCRRI
jgi:hypothetical protein